MTSWQGGRMKDTYITQPQFAMIWFGAALSIAEIMTGTYLAPLGLTQGLYAVSYTHLNRMHTVTTSISNYNEPSYKPHYTKYIYIISKIYIRICKFLI